MNRSRELATAGKSSNQVPPWRPPSRWYQWRSTRAGHYEANHHHPHPPHLIAHPSQAHSQPMTTPRMQRPVPQGAEQGTSCRRPRAQPLPVVVCGVSTRTVSGCDAGIRALDGARAGWCLLRRGVCEADTPGPPVVWLRGGSCVIARSDNPVRYRG